MTKTTDIHPEVIRQFFLALGEDAGITAAQREELMALTDDELRLDYVRLLQGITEAFDPQ